MRWSLAFLSLALNILLSTSLLLWKGRTLLQHRITTVDNPFNPFDEFDSWLAFDEQFSYHSCSLLARTLYISDDLSLLDQTLATRQAIMDIIALDPNGIYRMVSKEVEPEFVGAAKAS